MKPFVLRRILMSWPGLSAYPSQWRYGVFVRGAVEPIAVFVERLEAQGFRDEKNSAEEARRSNRR